MDASSAKWLSKLEMDDEYSIIHQCYLESVAKFTDSSNQSYQTSFEGPNKLHKIIDWNYSTDPKPLSPKNSSPISQILSFENSNSKDVLESQNYAISDIIIAPISRFLSFEELNSSPAANPKQLFGTLNCSVKPTIEAASPGNTYFTHMVGNDYLESQSFSTEANICGTKRSFSMTGTPSLVQDHIIAERRRREKLTQSIIALSTLLPGLKKKDKASILEDAIKHVKELQERVKILEEQNKKRRVESVVFVSKSQVSAGDESHSCDANNGTTPAPDDAALPQIEARSMDNVVLIRIHCEKQQGLLAKIISQIEMFHFSVVNTSLLPFGNSTYDITIIAEKNVEFSMTVKDLVSNLRLTLLTFM